MVSADDANASGGKYITSATVNSGTGTWDFSVPVADDYIVWGRVLGANANTDSFFVKMDSGSEDVYDDAENTWSANWQWTKVNGRNGGDPLTLNPRIFTLTSGSHSLQFRGRETNSKVDRILITNDSSFTP
jgi:hypothetical protein